ncbi:unnamed protein product [Parnassius apollo]|uniref:(apollo) hypothetical protein n=1 Tax=Parnassius apollo TaxID=110799 RepID=A0A8S3YB55_PARAO|nr:unnamed protein product [Parnassius apollo]
MYSIGIFESKRVQMSQISVVSEYYEADRVSRSVDVSICRGIGSQIVQVDMNGRRPAARELCDGPPGRGRCLHTSARVWSAVYEPTWLLRARIPRCMQQ